jgi:hypothetical protein
MPLGRFGLRLLPETEGRALEVKPNQPPAPYRRRRVWPFAVAGALTGASVCAVHFHHLWSRPIPQGIREDHRAPVLITLTMFGMFLIVSFCGCVGALLGYLIGRLVRRFV